jgi:16S rRNA (cytosine1402-N4)-methyltransferase
MWAYTGETELENESPSVVHTTVLREETIAALDPRADGVYVDATLGMGGHAEALLEHGATVIGIDRDPSAIASASVRLAKFGQRVRVLQGSFGDIVSLLRGVGVEHVDGIVADLGISSAQLADGSRGMSFRLEGPLDMRMDPGGPVTALDLIRGLGQEELANVLFRYGEERKSRRIARCIKLALMDGRLSTTTDLRKAVVRAVGPARVGGVDPATRTFQALRIAVNHELDQLEQLIEGAHVLLAPGGVLAAISFHSLEDRILKRAMRDKTKWELLTKKPVVAGVRELQQNPRARSAKLRSARAIVCSSSPQAKVLS